MNRQSVQSPPNTFPFHYTIPHRVGIDYGLSPLSIGIQCTPQKKFRLYVLDYQWLTNYFHIYRVFFTHSACGIKISPYTCNVVQRQCSLTICDSNHHYSAPLTAVLVGIKHSNQCQQQRTKVGMGRRAEHEHLEIRMHTANRWSYGNYLE